MRKPTVDGGNEPRLPAGVAAIASRGDEINDCGQPTRCPNSTAGDSLPFGSIGRSTLNPKPTGTSEYDTNDQGYQSAATVATLFRLGASPAGQV